MNLLYTAIIRKPDMILSEYTDKRKSGNFNVFAIQIVTNLEPGEIKKTF